MPRNRLIATQSAEARASAHATTLTRRLVLGIDTKQVLARRSYEGDFVSALFPPKNEANMIFERSNGHPARRTCMLLVTHACNLNCVYCYEKFKDDRGMSFSMAKSIIEKEIDLVKQSDKFAELEVDFMGGEPLVNFSLIRDVVEWMKAMSVGVPFVFFFNTNGTLLDDEKKSWLRLNRQYVYAGLSYDGSLDSQNGNRGTHKYAIDVEFFRDNWPRQPLKMTVSKSSVQTMADDVIGLLKRGCRVDASLAQGVDWDVNDSHVLDLQMQKLAQFYLKNPNVVPDSFMSSPLRGFNNPSKDIPKFCGSGTYMTTYDVDGRQYPCHMFTPLVLGPRALTTVNCALSTQKYFTDEACRDCLYRQWCGTCHGFNYKDRGDVSSRDKAWCNLVPVIVKNLCEFQIAYYDLKHDELADDDFEHLNALLECHNAIKDLY